MAPRDVDLTPADPGTVDVDLGLGLEVTSMPRTAREAATTSAIAASIPGTNACT